MDEALFRISHNAIATASEAACAAASAFRQAGEDLNKPHVYMRPRVFLDVPGTWCCMYGDNLAENPAGFGDSPYAACADFDRRWFWSQAQIDKYDLEKAPAQSPAALAAAKETRK